MPTFPSLLLATLAPVLASGPIGAGDLDWQPSLDAALERAASENKLVLVAVIGNGGSSLRVLDEVYGDKDVATLAAAMLNVPASSVEHAKSGKPCPVFRGVTCADHGRVERELRERLKSKDALPTPAHALLGADGEVLLSVPGAISAEELVWSLATAQRAAGMDVKDYASAHPPHRATLGRFAGAADASESLSRAEARELVAELKKGAGGAAERKAVAKLCTADEPEAVEYVKQMATGSMGVGGRRGGAARGGDRKSVDELKIEVLGWIGTRSPKVYWEVAAEHSTSSNDELRAAAASALEQLAAPDSLKAIRAALGKEKDPSIEARWVRALGAAGAADKRTRSELLKRARSEKDPVQRANAIVALGYLAPTSDVDDALLAMLAGDDYREQAAAACALGIARLPWRAETLRGAIEATDDDTVASACTAALKVLEGSQLRALAPTFEQVTGETKAPPRLFAGTGNTGSDEPGKRRRD